MAQVYDWPSFLIRITCVIGISSLTFMIWFFGTHLAGFPKSAKNVANETGGLQNSTATSSMTFYILMLATIIPALPYSLTGNHKIAMIFMILHAVLALVGVVLTSVFRDFIMLPASVITINLTLDIPCRLLGIKILQHTKITVNKM